LENGLDDDHEDECNRKTDELRELKKSHLVGITAWRQWNPETAERQST